MKKYVKMIVALTVICGAALCGVAVRQVSAAKICYDKDGKIIDCNAGGSGGIVRSCSTAERAYQIPCKADLSGEDKSDGGGAGGGGASWHIYKIDGSVQPTFPVGGSLISGSDILPTVISTCRNVGAEYYAAFGWEPIYSRNPGISLWGPAAVGRGAIASALYNNYAKEGANVETWSINSDNIDERMERLKSGNVKDDIKLMIESAETLREKVAGASGRVIDSSVGAFCFSPSWFDSDYYGKSNVSIRTNETSRVESTGITSNPSPAADIGTVNVKLNDSATIVFSHNVYDKPYMETGMYEVRRDWPNGTLNITSMSGGTDTSSYGGVYTATFSKNDMEGEYYIGGERTKTDGGGSYFIARDRYVIKFETTGSYRFCESLYAGKDSVNLKQKTQACVTVNVTNSDNPNPDGGNPGSNNDPTQVGSCKTLTAGLTEVTSQVKNTRLVNTSGVNAYGGWQSSQTYAMPTDEIRWVDCYIPGAQSYANNSVSKFYKEPSLATKSVTYTEEQEGATVAVSKDDRTSEKKTISIPDTSKPRVYNKQTGMWEYPKKDFEYTKWSNADEGTDDATGKKSSEIADDYEPKGKTFASEGTEDSGATYWDGHAAEGVCHNTTHATKTMQTVYKELFGHDWTNQFQINTTSPYGFNNSNKNVRAADKHFPSNTVTWSTYTVGETDVRAVRHNYVVARVNDASKTYWDGIMTDGHPIFSEYSNDGKGYHPWTCCSCSSCGCCGCEDGCCGCCCCGYSHTNLYYIGGAADASEDGAGDESQVTIPYNYENSTAFGISSVTPGKPNEVYAGETIRLSNVKTNIGKRPNEVVEESYTTQVDDASVRLIAFVAARDNNPNGRASFDTEYDSFDRNADSCSLISGYSPKQCEEDNRFDGTLNPNGELRGYEQYMDWDGNYNVFDASAGDYMCFVMAVYPATSGRNDDPGNTDSEQSGGDRNTKSYGDKRWRVSSPRCIQIAKKPMMQILGGDLFTNGSIATSVSVKQPLLDVDDSRYKYLPRNRGRVVVNGSWVEEGIMALGRVNGLSSGASLGRVWSDARQTGAINATNLCDTRSPLSFANYSLWSVADQICPNYQTVGYVNGTNGNGYSGAVGGTVNRSALADYWGVDGVDASSIYLHTDEGNVDSATGRNIKVYSHEGEVIVRGGRLSVGTMRIVRATGNDGTVTIAGDIYYDAGTMTAAQDLPKVIIYGKNINIACGVGHIDAILIAEEKVNTCSDGTTDVNNEARSNQLVINGAVTANGVELPRTYGNSVGTGSGIPAEILNYDASMMVWGRFMAGSSESDTMTTTYMRELAPRH